MKTYSKMKTPNRVKNARKVVFSKDFKRYKKDQTYYMDVSLAENFKKRGAPVKSIDKIDYESSIKKASKKEQND